MGGKVADCLLTGNCCITCSYWGQLGLKTVRRLAGREIELLVV